MSDYEIKCGKCDQPITHVCNEEFKDALIHFLSWVPEGMWASGQMAEAFKKESISQGDEHNFQKQPFFGSQAWSYLIWYKEDARSFHAAINNMIRAAGIDPYQLGVDLYHKRQEEEKIRKEEDDRRQQIIEKRRLAKEAKEKEQMELKCKT